jgi:hypothetical protein
MATLTPTRTRPSIGTLRRYKAAGRVIHNVHMNVVQIDVMLLSGGRIVVNVVPKLMARLGQAHLDEHES